jgi:hypothetical protein
MTDAPNPWISRPASPPDVSPEPASSLPARPTGPTAPQRGIPAPDRADQLPTVEFRTPAVLWWVGVHGGAGESSLAQLVPGWRGTEHAWPSVPSDRGRGRGRTVLVARSNVRGLRAAQAAATQWAAGLVPWVDVVGLVVVADAPGRLPRPLRDLHQLVAGGVPRTWTVPWIESWRLGDSVSLDAAPREVRRLVDDLRALLGPGAAGTTHQGELQ